VTAGPPLFGRTAVVTGASRGIGLAVAEELMTAGAHVVRLARSLAATSSERRTDIRCDVTDAAAVAAAADRIRRERGAVDLLVLSAGTFLLKSLEETAPPEFQEQIASNLTGPFLVLRAFLPSMRARGRGLVVLMGSVADHVPLPGNAAYVAAKHGLRGLHGALAQELRGTGVRITLVSPGPVDTEIWDPVDPDNRPGFTPRAAMLRPEDVAEAVAFVATRPERVAIPVLHIEPRP
jgi:NAD(P)-dependent dehydrogenase (short-subunit alcohol dehydrogenase family)